ncbi:hypothetical protein L829_4417 [Mycobacteroides abscessus MAB_030201_1075]|uniref:Uncharacterized protein n=2 Tax=Mycobacteroides abscessus TaxID=36809 RepID=A0A829PUK6_9MYCO|nr:hypothetical protein MA4S0206_3600 [Mycobacteroides abscessus 4S-0206]ETZ62267.1 hypothetical protein L836_3700 [Mycobacteroides abscessus MAB_110811_2726]ETZ90831.1 hypothetical protein L829_4417 [Mycobacteroides abscessus MAB_030201_1075]EUA48508.1 hypothetical protein I543_4044 [Mycobacteroides abscessus 21]EUA75056.1 hypothetical protein I541_4437 [Mycobacteroides abscessus]
MGKLVHDAGSRSCTAATENKGERGHRPYIEDLTAHLRQELNLAASSFG